MSIYTELSSRELIKLLLDRKKIKQKDLAEKLSEMTGKKYTPDNFSHRIRRNYIYYDEMLLIAKILGYEIDFKNTGNELI